MFFCHRKGLPILLRNVFSDFPFCLRSKCTKRRFFPFFVALGWWGSLFLGLCVPLSEIVIFCVFQTIKKIPLAGVPALWFEIKQINQLDAPSYQLFALFSLFRASPCSSSRCRWSRLIVIFLVQVPPCRGCGPRCGGCRSEKHVSFRRKEVGEALVGRALLFAFADPSAVGCACAPPPLLMPPSKKAFPWYLVAGGLSYSRNLSPVADRPRGDCGGFGF